MKPTCRVRQRASSLSDMAEMMLSPTVIVPVARLVEAGDQVQQRRLAGPGRPHEREELGLADVERRSLRTSIVSAAAGERLVQVANLNQRAAIGRVPVWRRRC